MGGCVLAGVFPVGGVVVVTGPEQHAATVRDGERIAAELYAAAEKGGVTWSQLEEQA